MCFDDEGRHHGGNEESSALWWAPNPSTPACKHKWHRSRRRSLRSSSRVPLPPPSPTPTLPAPPVLARPDETDETDVLERPLSDETDETDVLERPLLALIGKGSGDDVAGRRRGRTCNRAQSDAIRCDQMQSDAIRCNQMQSGPAIERNHMRSDAIRCNQDLQSSAIICDQMRSDAIRTCSRAQSDAIRGHQTALASLPGVFIYRNQTPSVRCNLRRTSTELAASTGTCCCRSRRRGVSCTLAITVSGSSSGAPN